jgi:hypothetical protein
MNLADNLVLYADSIEARDFSQKQRKKLAKTGAALPGGGFPIVNKQDLKNAERAIGRAGNPGAAKAHIRERAKALHVNLSTKWKKGVKADSITNPSNPSSFGPTGDMGPSKALSPA